MKRKKVFNTMLGLFLSAALALSCTGQLAIADEMEQQETFSVESGESGVLFDPSTYEGEGQGNNGTITVSVTFSETAITDIQVVNHSETDGICDTAIERIPQDILETQSLAVDTVSGATHSSEGILEAVSACIIAAGADPDDFMTVSDEDTVTTTSDVDCDIVIVGAGGAGLTAALSALQNGAENVIVLEKQAVFGGASSVAGGLAGGCSELQKSFGITEDTPEQIFEDIMTGGGGVNQEDLVWIWAENMGSTVDWLIDNGVPIENQFSNFSEHTYQRSYSVTGGSQVMLQVLADDIIENGGRIDMETTAKSLIYEDGAVTGVVAEDASGNTINYHADKVLMATGGFGANSDMLSDELSIALFYGVESSTGEGIQMMEDVGAALCFMDYAKMYPTGIEVEEGYARVATVHTLLTTQTSGAILVNKEGERVINENVDFVSLKNITKEQTDNILYLVMDQEAYDIWAESANASESASGRFTYEEQEAWFEADGTPIFVRSDDLVEAAEMAGIDSEALVSTVENWNSMVSGGADDEFGREELFELQEDSTYYIIEEKLRFATTLGGVTVNTNFEVQNEDGESIPGLYAAGECVGGVHGYESMPTCMLSWAVTSGNLAGAVLAED
ncbi:MAG: FAD-dependent oxidoreductase [Lachnospiraceae bacterium]|nr:FAD-dependent oxidoreductase [Lachnospiraceae bacterium]